MMAQNAVTRSSVRALKRTVAGSSTLVIINAFAGESGFQTDFVELHNVYAPVASRFRSAWLVVPSDSGITQSGVPEWIRLRTVAGGLRQPLRFLIESAFVSVSLAAAGNAVIWAQDPLICGLSALIASRIAGATTAIDLHNDFLEGWTKLRGEAIVQRFIARFVAKRADRLRAVSCFIASSLVRHGVIRNDVVIIPCPVDLQKFDQDNVIPDSALSSCWPEQRQIALVPAALVERKGHALLIRSADILRDRFPALRFAFAGEGPLRKELLQLIYSLRLEDRFLFLGRRPHADIPALLAASHMVVLPSLDEGAPRAAAEAMAMGRLVVGTTATGALVKDGETGILVSPDPNAIAAGLARAMTLATADRASLLSRAHLKIASQLDQKVIVSRLLRELLL
jgi:glycosyltransferase involved in cell wall biosynthesis